METHSPWRTTPVKSRIIFLFAVFFIFAGCGIAFDTIDMGRGRPLRLALSVVIYAVFAVAYATSGVILRRRFWKAFLPLFVLQNLVMAFLGHYIPDSHAELIQYDAAETSHLHHRLAFDGVAMIISVVLGYVGFVIVSISESRRYVRSQTEKAALESEMAAAREVQRLMVPEDLPPIHGFAIESVYRPAADVGGDFFQVIPLSGGSTLVVIGDVSGKGLRAAMIVSMIVGMLHTVSTFTEEPVTILTELNRCLCGRMHGGFATCMAVRLEDGGRLALANAGHPAPYLNGAELPFLGSMPLGLAETAAYEQSTLQMQPGDRIVLLTDGIPEARNQQRVLFGFSRVESILRDGASARVVADAAQQFGQDDDLTVISIGCESACAVS